LAGYQILANSKHFNRQLVELTNVDEPVKWPLNVCVVPMGTKRQKTTNVTMFALTLHDTLIRVANNKGLHGLF